MMSFHPRMAGFRSFPAPRSQVRFGALNPEAQRQVDQLTRQAAQHADNRNHYHHFPPDAIAYHVALTMDGQASPAERQTSERQLLSAVGNNPAAAQKVLSEYADQMRKPTSRETPPKSMLRQLIRILDESPEGPVVMAIDGFHNGARSFKAVLDPELDTLYLKTLFKHAEAVSDAFTPHRQHGSTYYGSMDSWSKPFQTRFLVDVLSHQAKNPPGDPELIASVEKRLLQNINNPMEHDDLLAIQSRQQRALSLLITLRGEFKDAPPPRSLVETLLDIAEKDEGASRLWSRRDSIFYYDSAFPPDLEARFYQMLLRDPYEENTPGLLLGILDHLLIKHGPALVESQTPDGEIYARASMQLLGKALSPPEYEGDSDADLPRRRREQALSILRMAADPRVMKSELPAPLAEGLIKLATSADSDETPPDDSAPDFSWKERLGDLQDMRPPVIKGEPGSDEKTAVYQPPASQDSSDGDSAGPAAGRFHGLWRLLKIGKN